MIIKEGLFEGGTNGKVEGEKERVMRMNMIEVLYVHTHICIYTYENGITKLTKNYKEGG
jgi:hypothetical protein